MKYFLLLFILLTALALAHQVHVVPKESLATIEGHTTWVDLSAENVLTVSTTRHPGTGPKQVILVMDTFCEVVE
jgi:hypothetical protein